MDQLTKIVLVNVKKREIMPRQLKPLQIKPETDFVWMVGVVKVLDHNKYVKKCIRKLISEKAYDHVIKRGYFMGYSEASSITPYDPDKVAKMFVDKFFGEDSADVEKVKKEA